MIVIMHFMFETWTSMWPLYPEFDNRYKLVCTLFLIGCLMSVTLSLTKWLIETTYFLPRKHGFSQVSPQSGYVCL